MNRRGAFAMLWCAGLLCLMAILGHTTAAFAQQNTSNRRVATEVDWVVYQDTDPFQCWAASAPKKMQITENGRPVRANRGQVLLFVFFQPEDKIDGQVAFASGYPFAEDRLVTVKIGNREFDLITTNNDDDGWAHPIDERTDTRLVAAMRAGSTATVIGHSQRGKVTTDTFSLRGFTKAVREAEVRCREHS